MFLKYIRIKKRVITVYSDSSDEKSFIINDDYEGTLKQAIEYRDSRYYTHKVKSNTGYKHIRFSCTNGYVGLNIAYKDKSRGLKYVNTIYLNKDTSYEEALQRALKELSIYIGITPPKQISFTKGLETLKEAGFLSKFYLYKVHSDVASCTIISNNEYNAEKLYRKTLTNIVHGRMLDTSILDIKCEVEYIADVRNVRESKLIDFYVDKEKVTKRVWLYEDTIE